MKLAQAIHSVVGGTISTDHRDAHITTKSGCTRQVASDGSLSGGEIVSPPDAKKAERQGGTEQHPNQYASGLVRADIGSTRTQCGSPRSRWR